MSPRTRWILGSAIVVLVGAPLVRKAFLDRRRHNAELAELAMMAERLTPIAKRAATNRRVIINGAPVFFGLSTTQLDVRAALDHVSAECQKGELGVVLPARTETTTIPRPLTLQRVNRHEQEGIGASLCVFKNPGDETAPQIRYTIAHKNDQGTTSLFTVATESNAQSESLFPEEGDVPGGEIAGVPRPHGSRRVFAASIEGETHEVRIYEVKEPMADVVRKYDADMTAAGFTRSAAVATALPDVRAYTLGKLELVASFQQVDDMTIISIAPFEPTR